MAQRCFLFSSDGGTSDVIRQVLTGLGVEGESCPDATTAAEKIAHESFQLVIVDWDQQPEGGQLLVAARERKASERPLILAIVSDDASVPKALQAGANSILRRPFLVNQVKDTLTTARDLLRARMESTTTPAQAAAAAAAASPTMVTPPPSFDRGTETQSRGAEFLVSAPAAPVGSFETDSEVASFHEQSPAEAVSPLKDLEPVATSVPTAPPPPSPDEPKSLEELLRSRGVHRQAAPPEPPPSAPDGKPELLGFDQTPTRSARSSENASASPRVQKKEPEIFSSFVEEPEQPKATTPSRFRLRKGPIIGAAILAGCAILLAPQAPWHSQMTTLLSRSQRSLHTWLNPQPVTTAQAPTAHEDFARAGDEYKLPVAENIPDATTDPSQINVVPVVDPTAKKPANSGPDQPAVLETPTNSSTTPAPGPTDGTQPPVAQPPATQPSTSQPATVPATTEPAASQPIATPATTSPAPVTPTATASPTSNNPATTYTPVSSTPAPPKRDPVPYTLPPAPKVPSSLQSQMATMVPEASGNKPPEAAMPSIEPVSVSEQAERALLDGPPKLDYPAAAGTQQGTVLLDVLIGRDGAVQDAKFLQGSLAFARSAIASVKQWKFKPYTMNGRPVSVETKLTLSFKPGQ